MTNNENTKRVSIRKGGIVDGEQYYILGVNGLSDHGDSAAFTEESVRDDECRLKVHPENAETTPEQFCELFGHKHSYWNSVLPWRDNTCLRCGENE